MWHCPVACLPVLCVRNVNELKQLLLDAWYGMEQSMVDTAINEWLMRLFEAKVENIQQMLQQH